MHQVAVESPQALELDAPDYSRFLLFDKSLNQILYCDYYVISRCMRRVGYPYWVVEVVSLLVASCVGLFSLFLGFGIGCSPVTVTLATTTLDVPALALLDCEEQGCEDSANHAQEHAEIAQSKRLHLPQT